MTDAERVRLRIADTDVGSPRFTDAELESFLADEGSVTGAAAAAAESLQARFSTAFDIQSDDQALKRSQMAKAFGELADSLRTQQGHQEGIGTIVTEKVDGYNDTGVDNESAEGTSGKTGRVRQGYLNPDQVP